MWLHREPIFSIKKPPRACSCRWTMLELLPRWAQRTPPIWHLLTAVWPRPMPSAFAGPQSYSVSSSGSWWTPTPSERCQHTRRFVNKLKTRGQKVQLMDFSSLEESSFGILLWLIVVESSCNVTTHKPWGVYKGAGSIALSCLCAKHAYRVRFLL